VWHGSSGDGCGMSHCGSSGGSHVAVVTWQSSSGSSCSTLWHIIKSLHHVVVAIVVLLWSHYGGGHIFGVLLPQLWLWSQQGRWLSNAPCSCACACVCAHMLEFVCFLVDYSLALGSAYLADLSHSLGLVLVLYITHSLVVRFVLVLQYSSCFFCTVQFSLVM